MKRILSITILLAISTMSIQAELIRNGDVLNMQDWKLRIAPHYIKNASQEPVISYPEGHIRIGLTADIPVLQEACHRISLLVTDMRPAQ